MKALVLLVLISMMGAIPIKDVQKQLAAKALMEMHTALERPAPAYRMRRQVDDQDAQVEFTVPYCPEDATLSGTAFQILNQTIVDAVDPTCPETLVGDACDDYSSELRKCIVTRIPDFINKIRMENFILTEEEKQMLAQMSMLVAHQAMNINPVNHYH